MRTIDHFMYAGRDLDTLNQAFAGLTGVTPTTGGSHPTLGTRNSLVGTGATTYLELIAPDPALSVSGELRADLEGMTRNQLHRFIMQCDQSDFPALAQAYGDAGIAAPVYDLQRITPTGTTLSWKLMIPAANDLGLFAPYFIDWLDSPHPSKLLGASGCTIAGCVAAHPEHDRVARLWERLGVPIPLGVADHPSMRLQLQTSRGLVELTSI